MNVFQKSLDQQRKHSVLEHIVITCGKLNTAKQDAFGEISVESHRFVSVLVLFVCVYVLIHTHTHNYRRVSFINTKT